VCTVFTVLLPVYILSCAASGVIQNDKQAESSES